MKRKEATDLEDLSSGASSSSISPRVGDYGDGTKKMKGNDYEVFLSFRGKDTRKGFTDHLYTSLVDAGIHVFKDDDELRVGEEIGPELLYSITQSIISIAIISEDYASSKWCLCELVQMLKCRKSKGQVVLPIFYKVEPSHVRHLKGRFEDAINAHKQNSDQMVVKEWEEALKEISSLKGWESEKINYGHEAALVKMVVTRVMSELKRYFHLNVSEELVGTDDRVKQIMSKINFEFNGTLIIGIYGMGGIGKTTFAKVLYNKLSSHFENRNFMENIRETSRKGIEYLQNRLMCDIKGSSWKASNVDEGIHILRSRFTSTKVLTLLDDMDDNSHLDALVGDGSWFATGSIVIITTRNKSILDKARASHMYELKELSFDQSLILFSRHAFRKDYPPNDYKVISCEVVSTTGGLPLALEIIGSFLSGLPMEVWKDTSKKLKKMPNEKVQEKLRISYEALTYEEQQIYLDIACYFIGESKQCPIYMWDACDFFPSSGIEVLILKCLIKVDEHGKLLMHDQLRDLGRNIVRLENQKKLQKRSRLWISEEAEDVLANSKGTGKIEALCLGNCGNRKSYRDEQFKELTNLRFLDVCGVNLIGDFQNKLLQLRWLNWKNCPSNFEVVNFHPKKLVVLDLSHSKISENWGGWGPLKMAIVLKVLKLSYCDNLRRTPDLSDFESLEVLNLNFCWNMNEIHPSIWSIKTLVSLEVQCCPNLEELPARVGSMEESRELPCHDKLTQLPESTGSLESLTQLDLSESGIKELPESIDSMKALKTLNAFWCASLARLPSSIGNLACLSLLNLSSCCSLREIPDSIGKLTSLIDLQLSGTSITELPKSIGNLQNLRNLYLNETLLTELPGTIGLLTNLQQLSASNCKSLEGLPSSIGGLVSLNDLQLDESGIRGLPESISKLSSLQYLDVRYCENLREIPEPPSSLISLCITFPTPSLPFLPKLTLLGDLHLFDLRPLECLPELPGRLLRLRIQFGHLADTDVSDLKEAIPKLIHDKSSGQRKATFYPDVWDELQYDIREAFPDLSDLQEAISGGNELK